MARVKDERRFDEQVAVVTGASAGIGRRVALDLADRGATTIGLARREDLLDEVGEQLRRRSSGSSTLTLDVGDQVAFAKALADIEAEHGRIDVVVNNAAINEPTSAEDGFSDAYRRILDVNLFGVVTGTLSVLPGMLARGSGTIVNVSSDTARAPEPGAAAYAASKAAVAAFSESIAHEVAGRGVHVHVLYPAWVPTDMGMSGIESEDQLPPKPVRRTEEQVSRLLLARMGGDRMEINAAVLPLLAPIGRTIAPRAYQRGIRSRFAH